MNRYTAFGLVIESEFPIVQLACADLAQNVDVVVRRKDLSGENMSENYYSRVNNIIRMSVSDAGRFVVADGCRIDVDPFPICTDTILSVYLMGFCMGAVLHQRGLFPLHGSCVTDGQNVVVITGDSGAGKSTLAFEFLAHGWRLLTDDVSLIKDIETSPMVQSSFPSQKLWQDSLNHFQPEGERVRSLYEEDGREKFGISAADRFFAGTAPLTHIIRLLPADAESCIQPIEGMAKVDQLMYNTYRFYMIDEKARSRHFQRCVNLAQKVPMSLVVRNKKEQTAEKLYEMIVDTVKKHF